MSSRRSLAAFFFWFCLRAVLMTLHTHTHTHTHTQSLLSLDIPTHPPTHPLTHPQPTPHTVAGSPEVMACWHLVSQM